jgi:hypothetical protein
MSKGGKEIKRNSKIYYDKLNMPLLPTNGGLTYYM